jgi:formylglycine-generating enzyme required for sulfatase activity
MMPLPGLITVAYSSKNRCMWSGSYGQGSKGEYRQKTTPVDLFGIANNFGLCDMHGNVWEWCQDPWHKNYIGAPTNESTWLVRSGQGVLRGGSRRSYISEAPGDSNERMLRGGSWLDCPRNCRSAYRYYASPSLRIYHVGFRAVCNTQER